MQKINLHNYEAYFLDYLEGRLSAEEIHDLNLFLEQNPDKKEELDLNLDVLVLEPTTSVFESKSDLKIADAKLNSTNVDEWMIASVENQLSIQEQLELNEFVKLHSLENTFAAFKSTILKADLTEVFPNKKKLKVPTGIIIPLYMRVAAVAAVLLLFVTVALNNQTSNDEVDLPQAGMIQSPNKLNDKSPDHNQDYAFDSNSFNSKINQYKKNEIATNEFIVQSPNEADTSDVKNNENDNIANNDNQKDFHGNNDDDLAVENNSANDVILTDNSNNIIVFEEPFKVVTNAAGNIINKDIQFVRGKESESNEYVAYGFKVGNFEFSRKK